MTSKTLRDARRHRSWITRAIAAAFGALLATPVIAEDAPPGFVWEAIKPLGAKVLRVAGWNHGTYDSDEGPGYVSYVNDDRGEALAHFGLYVRRAPSRKVSPERIVASLMSESTQKFEPTGPIKQHDSGPFAGASGFFSRGVQPEEGSVHLAYFEVMVSKTTRTGYIVMFETPETAWAEQWKIGQVIVNSVRLKPAR
jgi:hypothetical protein